MRYKPKFLILGIFASLLCSCAKIAEYRVTSSGATEPRNSREKVIFDYFNALKMGDYESAYQLVHPEAHQNFSSFTSAMSKNRYALPKIISIGKEKKRNSDDNAVCNYTYTVYAVDSGSHKFISGEVSIMSSPDKHNSCVIGYNSAFGGI